MGTPCSAPRTVAMAGADDDSYLSSRIPSLREDRLDDIATAHPRGEIAAPGKLGSARQRRIQEANLTCPFSHEPLESASGVDLRCGHRFALERLPAARRAAELCCGAGFAQKDLLICPRCGDQDNNSKPGTSKMLTTYSINTDAYLGDLRKDWQCPLQLPCIDFGPSCGRPVDPNSSNGMARPSFGRSSASSPTKC